MTDSEIGRALTECTNMRGAVALLQLLGFGRPEPARVPGRPSDVRRSGACAHGTILTGWVLKAREKMPGSAETEASNLRALARSLRASSSGGAVLMIVVSADGARVTIACDAVSDAPQGAVIETGRVLAGDIELVREMLPEAADGELQRALRCSAALDRGRLGARFFRDVTAMRDVVSASWSGLPRDAHTERDGLALLLLSRLIFLCFLQARGLLDGRRDFFARVLQRWLHGRGRGTFYRNRLRPLFFGVLNRRPENRTSRAAVLGDLPYLNGGLFEMHALERRRPELDLEDSTITGLFDNLLGRYRFSGGGDGLGVEPEMLGRMFEGLMPAERRTRTGTFYTPAPLVHSVVAETLREHMTWNCGLDAAQAAALLDDAGDNPAGALPENIACSTDAALRDLRVLDPACGSGAFLLGALSHIVTARGRLARHAYHADHPDHAELRRHAVAATLHGVDLLPDAALICSLRMWLSLIPVCERPADVPPLPNLDRRIRQGDALIDPLDLVDGGPRLLTSAVRRLTRQLEPVARAYTAAGPGEKQALRRRLVRLEVRLARSWLQGAERRVEVRSRELSARASDTDLFGEPASYAQAARRSLRACTMDGEALRAYRADLQQKAALPFFSFRVHFAEAADGFDVVLSNPPWVRAHHWPPAARSMLRERFRVCADAGWPYGASLSRQPAGAGAQVDLSLLFMEVSLRLLREGGTLGILLPAKLLRSLYAGGARAMLLQGAHMVAIDDHSLRHRAHFDADAFTCAVVARRDSRRVVTRPADSGAVRVTVSRADGEQQVFDCAVGDLPLRTGDAQSPWLLVPPDVRAAFRTMQLAGPCIGDTFVIRRGVMTGANDMMLARDVTPLIGDLARVRADGWHRADDGRSRAPFAAHIEASCLRPALRGTDVRAWDAQLARHLLWSPHNDDAKTPAPPRLAKYLRRHHGGGDGTPGTVHRVSADTFRPKVCWSDLASTLRACAVPSHKRSACGLDLPWVPLNTVYFIPVDADDDALLLAAYLNSRLLGTYARCIAERAKDAHFRFFAWTIAVLPLPTHWRDGPESSRLREISRAAHADGGIAKDAQRELDALVARAYRVDGHALQAVVDFGQWMAGS